MTSLSIKVDDVGLTLCTDDASADDACADDACADDACADDACADDAWPDGADQADPVSRMIQGMQCGHCGGGMEELNAPLTCGCVICDCMCPCWHDCPKHQVEQTDAPQTEMKKE